MASSNVVRQKLLHNNRRQEDWPQKYCYKTEVKYRTLTIGTQIRGDKALWHHQKNRLREWATETDLCQEDSGSQISVAKMTENQNVGEYMPPKKYHPHMLSTRLWNISKFTINKLSRRLCGLWTINTRYKFNGHLLAIPNNDKQIIREYSLFITNHTSQTLHS